MEKKEGYSVKRYEYLAPICCTTPPADGCIAVPAPADRADQGEAAAKMRCCV